jgi:anthranilate phosphoribosyltransferase
VTDVVGTGGDGAHTVNISTMAAIVTAAAGVRVVKHGGRSVSSNSGSADVLEALGIPLDLDPGQVARCVSEIGIGFTFAPNYHHGLRHAAPVRRALGVPTAINYLAPLTNPARPGTALIGCSNLTPGAVLAAVLAERGATALVVRGHDGLDEITTADVADVWTASTEGIRKATLDTARFGLRRARPGDLAGGDAACNAKVVRSVAAGALAARNGAAGAAAGIDDAFAAGLDQARAAVSSGTAARLLDEWITLAGELACPR